jgi:type I restriction enzyme S subunit
MEIEYPEDISCQQKIEAVLSSLDSKIEINNRINTELEVMDKTLYDYWFVQFDFPNENDKPYKTSGGKMVWNEELKREIPKGWNAISLEGFEKNIITGKTPSTKNNSYFNGDVPFICIGDIRGNMHIVETEITLTQSGAKTQLNKFIPQGAICVTCIASPGLVGFATKNSQTNQQINSIVCENEENRHYLYFYLKDYFKYARAKTGNTFANMNKGDFSSIKVIIPQKDILDNFHVHIDDSINKILSNTIQNQKLIELRDWLLPLLMNGQLKVN